MTNGQSPARRSQPIRLYLVDDQSILRASFRSLLAQDGRFEVVGDSGDARAAIAEIGDLRPDVVLLDISMPGLSGIDAIAPIRKAHPRAKVLMLSHHEAESLVDQAMRAGANGYLSKDSDPAELALAVEAVNSDRTYLTPKVAGGLVAGMRAGERGGVVPAGRLESLTPREREVLQLLALGKSNKEVARDLGVTLGTAKKHRENLQRKLDCHSAAELARLAIREGLLDPVLIPRLEDPVQPSPIQSPKSGLAGPPGVGIYLLVDQAIVRAGIRRMLEDTAGYRILGEAEAPRGRVTSIVRSLADVVVCGAYREALGVDLAWLEALKRHAPLCRVLLLAEFPGQPPPALAFARGIDGMIPTAAEPRELLLAVEAIRRGYRWLSPVLAEGERVDLDRRNEA